MKRIFPYLRPYLPRISLGLAIKFTGTIMDLLLPWILSYMIDDVVPLKEVPRIVFWGGAMVACGGGTHYQYRSQPHGVLGRPTYHRSPAS